MKKGESPENQSVPRTPSALVQAQQEGSAAMSKLADLVGDLSKSFAETSHMVPFAQHSPNTNTASHLVDIVCHDLGLSADDILDMVAFFSHHENEAGTVAYVALSDAQLRSMWVLRRLKELRAKSNSSRNSAANSNAAATAFNLNFYNDTIGTDTRSGGFSI